jgi:hypothetical protein
MRRLGQAIGILAATLAATACGSSGGGTVPSEPAAPLTGAAADHVRMTMMRLRLDDLGPNWRAISPRANQPATCEPNPKDVDITAGNWNNRGVAFAFGTTAQVESDAMVFATAADAQKTVDAFMQPKVLRCLKREVENHFHPKNGVKLLGMTNSRLRPQQVADGLSGFRLVLNLGKGNRLYKFFVDFLIVRQDRALGQFSYMNAFEPAPISTEYTLAQAIAQRGALAHS